VRYAVDRTILKCVILVKALCYRWVCRWHDDDEWVTWVKGWY